MKVELELKNGRRKAFPVAMADVLVKRGVATYATRDMRAAPISVLETREDLREALSEAIEEEQADEPAADPANEEAPYGYKADGTPRKRPGRPASGA